MRFIFPGVAPENAEIVYKALRVRLTQKRKIIALSDRRIRSLLYFDKGQTCTAVVGEAEQQGRGCVVAIFFDKATSAYLVCTTTRGVVKASPIFVSEVDVQSVNDF
jgi:hypothetical protein